MPPPRRESLLILLAALLVAILRSPLLLLHGRVIAEEGTVYFQQAWDSSAAIALLAPHQGYYSLFMNALTLLAERLLPVEWFAVTLTTASLLILLLTVYLAITCELFPTTRTRCLAAAIILFVPAIEVWLTAEDVQFYLSACTAIICLSSASSHRLVRSLTLLLAGLTGAVSCIFTPFFLWRAWRDRTRMAAVQAAILTLCSLVQAFFILHFRAGGRSASGLAKFPWFGPVLVLKVFSVAFFGRLGAFLAQRIAIHHPVPAVCLLFWLLAILAFAIFWHLARLGGAPSRLCFCMALTVFALDYTAIGEPLDIVFIGAFRYVFTGSLLLWLLPLIAYASTGQSASLRDRRLAAACLTLFLFWGAIDAAGYWTRFQNRTPDWQTEVAHWRKDPTYPIHVSPKTWPLVMHLRPH